MKPETTTKKKTAKPASKTASKKAVTKASAKHPLVLRQVTYPRTLSETERADLGKLQAEKLQDIEGVKDQSKSAVAEYKAQEKRMLAEVNEISTKLRSGVEQCTEAAIVEFDAGRGKSMFFRRLDGDKKGELLCEQPMTGEDRQVVMNFLQEERNQAVKSKLTVVPPPEKGAQTEPGKAKGKAKGNGKKASAEQKPEDPGPGALGAEVSPGGEDGDKGPGEPGDK